VALHFRCHLTSPFHTTRQEYASLWKCAPFVLGSTLRGALLSCLVTTHYDDAAIQAGTYQTEGIVAPFFVSPPRAYFSFGRFPDKVERQMESHTRIAIKREHGSVAGGALLSVEVVPAGTSFVFDVLLPDDDGMLAWIVEEGMRQMTEMTGLGGLRSIGLGQFAIEEEKGVTSLPLADHIADLRAHLPLYLDEGPLRLTLTTPYVLADGQSPWDGDPAALAQRLERELAEAAQAAGVEVDPPTIERVDAALRPDFIGRWSFERGCRENRLVAWPDSTLTLHLSETGDLETALALAQAFGLGDWSEWGFGRFEVEPERA
jgi:hypothetical protein